MKFSVLAFVAMILSFETFAQVRRGNPHHPGRRGTTVVVPAPGRVVVVPGRAARPVGPRYRPPGTTVRVYRTERRVAPVYSVVRGFSCYYGSLMLDRSVIHTFTFNSECTQALRDIEYYGDFCNGPDLYDMYGRHEASFTFSSECRNALGLYY